MLSTTRVALRGVMTFSNGLFILDSESPTIGMLLIGRFWPSCSAKCLKPFIRTLLLIPDERFHGDTTLMTR